jgi:hypothetical protein
MPAEGFEKDAGKSGWNAAFMVENTEAPHKLTTNEAVCPSENDVTIFLVFKMSTN